MREDADVSSCGRPLQVRLDSTALKSLAAGTKGVLKWLSGSGKESEKPGIILADIPGNNFS